MIDENTIQSIRTNAVVFDALSLRYVLKKEYFARLRKGGVDATIVTVTIDDNFEEAVRHIDDAYALVESNPEATIATTRREIEEAHRSNKVAFVLGFQRASVCCPIHWDR